METDHYPSTNAIRKPQSGWVSRLVQAIWKSFWAKIVALLAIVAPIVAIVTFVVGDSIPDKIRTGGAIGFSVLFAVVVVFYVARALVTLAREGQSLAEEVDQAWAQVRSLNAEKEEWQTDAKTPRNAARLASAVIGLVYYHHQVECLLGANGSLGITSKVSMAAKVSGITSVEHKVVAPHAPQDWDEVIELEAEDKDDRSVLLTPVLLRKTAERLDWALRAVPEYRKGHRIEYTYKESLPDGSFAMSDEEMRKRGLDWEFFFVRVRWPTERLSFSLTLPAKMTVREADFDVWFGRTESLRHKEEYHRLWDADFWQVKRHRRQEQIVYKLDVDDPIHGLYYVIKWRPDSPF